MKKVIRLTESDLIKIVSQVLSENKFKNQLSVDAILDKINKTGYESLTDSEKNILNNPDDESLVDSEDEEADGLDYVAKVLIEMGIVDEGNLKRYNEDGDEFFEIDNLNSVSLEFFSECSGTLRCYVDWDDMAKSYILKIGAWGPEECLDEKVDVYEYIHNHISEELADKDIIVFLEDKDTDLTDMYNFGFPS